MAERSQLSRSSMRRSGSGSGGGGGGTVTSLVAGDAGIVITNAAGPVVTVGQLVAAKWPLGNPRVYAVDGTLGNDANAGFADAAGPSAGQYAAACAAAGLVAKKTIAGLAAIFPGIGSGRIVVILIKAGTYTDDLATVLGGVEGYASGGPLVRGTVTNATAASVAFAGDAADETMSGGVTAPGMNAPGYHPTGAPTSSQIQCLTLGGGAPGFGAEPAVPLGWRLRFDSATTTAALRNQCRQVCQVSGTDTLRLQTVLPAIPVAADTFYLEQAGVIIPAFNLAAPANGQLGIQFSGIQSSGTWGVQFADVQWAFCSANAVVAQQQTINQLGASQSFTNPILGLITPGGGLRSETTFTLNQGYASLAGLVSATSTTLVSNQVVTWGPGCAARNLAVVASRLSQNVDVTTPASLGTANAVGIPHTFGTDGVGAVQIDGSDLTFQQMSIIGAGATPAIQVRGKSSIIFAGSVNGATGNTDVGLDLANSAGSQIQILATAAPTVTGTTADVRWAGPAFGTWTQFQFQEQYDSAGNHIYQVVQNAEYDHTITPSVTLQVNNSGGTANANTLVAHTGASLQFRPAVPGDAVIGVLDRQTGNGEAAIVGALSGNRIVNFDVAPALGSLVYVSTTAGLATSTNPGNQTPLGVVVGNAFPGNVALVHWFGGANSPTLVAANWPAALTRVYAVDFVNGLDTNKGFADPVTASAGDYAVACAAAGAVAKKTFAGLAVIFPRLGNGRNCEVVIANGGVNTEQSYGDSLGTFLGGSYGYNSFDIRATGTNTTAAAVAFAGTTADVTYQGAITVTGLNVAGYNPVGATTTNLPCQLNGGGAAALPAEPAAPLGWRVRFDAATTTVALRNQCRQIAQVLTANTIIPQTAFTAAPANADIFYIEQAGVAVTNSLVAFGSGGNQTQTSPNNLNIGGIRDTGILRPINTTLRLVFTGSSTLIQNGSSQIIVSQSFTHPVLGAITIGGGHRSENGPTLTADIVGNLAGLVVGAGILTFNWSGDLRWTNGSFAGQVAWASLGVTGATASVPQIGSNTALAKPRASSLQVFGSHGQVSGCTFAGAGAGAAIVIFGQCRLTFSGVVCDGVTGNNDVGLDLTNSIGTLITMVTLPTVTGALGDIRLAGGQIITWAQANAGISDSKGNRFVGTGVPLTITQFAGSVIGAVGAVVSYLADTGPVAANQIVALRRPTSLRLAMRLRVTNIVNSSANAVTVTLYKNAVATAMTVSIPAATAAATKFVDSAHPILFADGDDYDLRMDDAADVAGVVSVSASLEWAV